MSEKKFTPFEVVEKLKKSLQETLKKADPVLSSILTDLKDKNAEAQVPKEEIPVPKDGVLYKIDGLQQQKIKAPSLKNNVPPNYAAMKIQSAAPKTVMGSVGMQKPKALSITSKLKGFMQKREEKAAMKSDGAESKLGSIARLRQEMSESQGVPVGSSGLVPKVSQSPITGKKTVMESPKVGGTVTQLNVPKISLPKSEES